ncbi:PadR family transcriptional regulator [Agromyces sp. Soil535]|uniref:PadR family transcriptional regulator n=1 Tax=Agromyces sp. Soil535 TaxID=1736390 RepID=UPI0006F479EE|nr:PadR family transcriptional regulator [Agromyces sp. Soil535]KRE21780.1 PadR family transcriptional regulator [Agromyces sp. Soil535]
MSKRPVSNPLALAVLSCLWERPMYPYEMTTTLRERGKEDSIRLNFGSLYAVIKSLEKHGLIEEARVEREGNRPERIVYAITEAGRVESQEWMRELIGTPVKEYPAFETGLSLLPLLPPDEAIALLGQRVERLDAELAERAEIAERTARMGLPELFLLEFHYRVAMITAERDHVVALLGRLESGAVVELGAWADLHRMIAEGASIEEIQAQIATYFPEGAAAPDS